MRLAAGGVIDPEDEKRRKAQAPTAQEVYGPAYRGIAGALSGARQPHQHRRRRGEVYRGVSMQGIADAVTPKNNLASHPIYSGVSAQGMIDAVMPGSGQAQAPGVQSAPQTPVVAPDTNALRRPTAISAPPSKFRRHRQRSGPCGLGWTRGTSEPGLSRSGRESPQVEGWRTDPGVLADGFNGPEVC